jgi:hypothetical protein
MCVSACASELGWKFIDKKGKNYQETDALIEVVLTAHQRYYIEQFFASPEFLQHPNKVRSSASSRTR